VKLKNLHCQSRCQETVDEDSRLVKSLVGAVVICIELRLAVTLQLLVLPYRVYKWSINLFTNPNPFYNHTTHTRENIKGSNNYEACYYAVLTCSLLLPPSQVSPNMRDNCECIHKGVTESR
jgi:hypothetical protein